MLPKWPMLISKAEMMREQRAKCGVFIVHNWKHLKLAEVKSRMNNSYLMHSHNAQWWVRSWQWSRAQGRGCLTGGLWLFICILICNSMLFVSLGTDFVSLQRLCSALLRHFMPCWTPLPSIWFVNNKVLIVSLLWIKFCMCYHDLLPTWSLQYPNLPIIGYT